MGIKFKKANESDCDLLYRWANDPVVRENAFNTNIITYEEHKKWFKEKLESEKSLIYIVMLDKTPIGQIRVDIDNQNGIISYSVSEEYRGKGYGTHILKKITDLVSENNGININNLVGKVKYNNIASQKAFKKAGYREIKEKQYIIYFKNFTNKK